MASVNTAFGEVWFCLGAVLFGLSTRRFWQVSRRGF
jgi:hypothetical protein